MNAITIDINLIENETIAIWLNDLFQKEIEEAESAADNEDIFALGSSGEDARLHKENAELNRTYVEILKYASNQIQKYWDQ